MGLCIYAANVALHAALRPWVSMCSPTVARPVRIVLSLVAAVAGWTIGYMVIGFLETGGLVLPNVSGRMRWLLLITLALAMMIGVIAGGYNELRDRLSQTIKAEQELEVARSIQSRLLPPPEIEGEGFAIAARNVPARYVAGDFYDVLRFDDGTVGIVVADVAGKGVAASLVMASVKAVLPFVANGSVDSTLRALNERLVGQLAPREFVALAYARFDPASGRLQLANAGMPDPYLVSSSIDAVAVHGARLPLGVRRDVRYDAVEVQLERGDRLVLFSDGIPEAPARGGEQLGYDAFRDTLATGGGIDAMLERVRAQVTDIDDDWTVVVLERT
jgi:serine phosphatase RsbU (regulator of sigma subunit)